jgi:hypothetical protein
MANLSGFTFTRRSDLATSSDGWGLIGVVDTLAGDDIITSTSRTSQIAIGGGGPFGGSRGTLNTGVGNDSISSTVSGNSTFAFTVDRLSSIITGGGNDSITAVSNGFFGIAFQSSGLIDTGAGNDSIAGTSNGNRKSAYVGNAISNDGTIDTGIGNDTITASGIWSFGIVNVGRIATGDGKDTITSSSTGLGGSAIGNVRGTDAGGSEIVGVIDTGAGDDSITATSSDTAIDNEGAILTGDGNDSITGTSTGSAGYGIINYNGRIDTGMGNDSITGSGSGSIGYRDILFVGIFNANTIKTGPGNDVVDALIGGFSGSGLISLGDGNDTLKGFATEGSVASRGSGRFDGGIGIDRLLIGAAGTYTVSSRPISYGLYSLSNGSDLMLIKGFELLGNANTGQTIPFAANAVITI